MKALILSSSKALMLGLLLVLSHHAFAQAGQLLFKAHLTGAEENPAVVTDGEGLISVRFSADRSTMFVQGTVTNLSGDITGAHFHAGNFGQNGGVVVNLAAIRSGNRFAGTLPVPAGFIAQALRLGIYANVHTAMHPGGEIRGQLAPEGDLNFGVFLNGANEVPPVQTALFGMGVLNITRGHDKVPYNIHINGLGGTVGVITAAHIHKGAAGVAGPVVVALSIVGNNLMGELSLANLPPDFLANLLANEYYVNVHTAANPGGEIRGQLSFNTNLNGVAFLNGDQETPPVNTLATGIGFMIPSLSLDSVIYGVITQGLSGPPTGAHVHKAPAGMSGGVVFPLTPGLVGGFYTGAVPINAATLTDLINNDLYFNIHTAANPGGEIRGQIQTNLRKAYTFDLCGDQEVPPNANPGYGAGMVSIDQGNRSLRYELLVDGLSDATTAAHIHTGNAGTNGGVKFSLVAPNPYSSGAIAIIGPDAAVVEAEGTYVNVHTAANPGGEIRGQVRRGLLCGPASAVFDPVVHDLKVFPNPVTEGITIQFESKEAFSGQLRLTDLAGRVLLQQDVEASGAGLQSWYFPVQNIAPGLYYLHLERLGATVFVELVIKM